MRGTVSNPKQTTWTPLRGFVRGTIHGLVVSILVVVITGFLAQALPTLVFNPFVRTALAFAICWVLLSVMQDSAGMTSVLITTFAVVLTLAVLLSHHFILARSGVVLPSTGNGPPMRPEEWLDPAGIGVLNYVPLIGPGMVVLLGHDGVPGGSGLADILTLRVFWGAWG